MFYFTVANVVFMVLAMVCSALARILALGLFFLHTIPPKNTKDKSMNSMDYMEYFGYMLLGHMIALFAIKVR